MLPDALEEYMVAIADLAFATKRARRSDLLRLCTWWEQTQHHVLDPTNLTYTHVERFLHDLRAQGTGEAAIERTTKTGRFCWAWLVAQRVVATQVFPKPVRAKSKSRFAAPIGESAFQVLVTELETLPDGHSLIIALLLLRSGLRPSEVVQAQVRDLDYAGQCITLRKTDGTTHRTLPLSNEVIARIQAVHDRSGGMPKPGWPLVGNGAQGMVVETLRRRLRRSIAQTIERVECERAYTTGFAARILGWLIDELCTIKVDHIRI
jgi:site-specific recombinase XerD